jgi:hypothetical protein
MPLFPRIIKMANAVHLSYTLTRIQRILNPLERLVYCLFGIFIFFLSLLGVLCMPIYLSIWIILGIWALCWLLFGRVLIALCYSLFSNTYGNTIEIEGDYVSFGVNRPEWKFPRSSLKVRKGVCETYMLRHIGGAYSIVLPREAIPFAELKELIERETLKGVGCL